MKRTVCCLLAIALVATVITASAPKPEATPKAEPIVLSCVSFWPKEEARGLYGWRLFKKLVNERAKGELVLEYKGGPEVIPIVEAAEALRKGVLDMIMSSGPYVAAQVPEALSLSLTTIHPSEQRKSGYYDLMVETFGKKLNAFFMGRGTFYTYAVYTAKRIDKVADLAGRKFRTVPTYAPFYKELGLVGVTMPLGEAYTALERGLVEGVTIPVESVLDFKWHEVLKYKFGPDFWMCEPFLAVNLDKWNKLPKHLQDLMKQTWMEIEPITYEHHLKEEKEIWAQCEKLGMRKIELSPSDAERLLDVVYSATWKTIEGKVGPEITAKLKKAATTK